MVRVRASVIPESAEHLKSSPAQVVSTGDLLLSRLCLPCTVAGRNRFIILENEANTARAPLLLTQFSSKENLAPTADELAAFQQQRAAEPSPFPQTLLRISKLLVNAGRSGQGMALQRRSWELTLVSWEEAFPGSWALWL